MKYAIIETWNGEGYSTENIALVKEFKNDADAHNYLRQRFKEQCGAKLVEEKTGFISYSKNDDQGSFLFIRKPQLLYGVMIETNVNEVYTILNKKDWRDKLSDAIKQSDPEEVEEIDLNDDNIFIGAYEGDYDYQFVKF